MAKDDTEILTRKGVLELLSKKAVNGSVTAMVCLERALRYEQRDAGDELDRELDRLLSRNE